MSLFDVKILSHMSITAGSRGAEGAAACSPRKNGGDGGAVLKINKLTF